MDFLNTARSISKGILVFATRFWPLAFSRDMLLARFNRSREEAYCNRPLLRPKKLIFVIFSS